MNEASCRIDVWLWRARFAKTRSLAATMVEKGAVRLTHNGAQTRLDKPSRSVHVGDRRQKAVIIGVPSYARQDVDAIALKSGSAPAPGTLLTDDQNAGKHRFGGGRGDTVRVIGAGAKVRPVPISGTGQYLGGGQLVADGGFAVFYGTAPTVAALGGTPGYTMLAMRLRDTSRAAARRTARAVETRLQAVPGFTG